VYGAVPPLAAQEKETAWLTSAAVGFALAAAFRGIGVPNVTVLELDPEG